MPRLEPQKIYKCSAESKRTAVRLSRQPGHTTEPLIFSPIVCRVAPPCE